MKRIVVVLMSLGMLVGALGTAEAGKSRRVERTVQGSYGPYPAPVTGCNEALGTYACMIVRARSTETFFTAKVTDTHGLPVFVDVLIYSGGLVDHATFCGATTRPIRIPAFASLEFNVGLLRDEVSTDCPANRVKSTGSIAVTLSNMR